MDAHIEPGQGSKSIQHQCSSPPRQFVRQWVREPAPGREFPMDAHIEPGQGSKSIQPQCSSPLRQFVRQWFQEPEQLQGTQEGRQSTREGRQLQQDRGLEKLGPDSMELKLEQGR